MSTEDVLNDNLICETNFASRHIGIHPNEIKKMLDVVGASSIDDLINNTVPSEIRDHKILDLPKALSEAEVLNHLRNLAKENKVMTSLIGMGWYDTYIPAVIARNILENPAWYSAYTPYQAEISQGRLEMLLGFQTMITDLTGMDIANASLLDEATAAAEAMALLHRASSTGETFLIDADCHPQIISVVETRAHPLGIAIRIADPWEDKLPEDLFGALIQYPGSSGQLRNLEPVVNQLKRKGSKIAVAADLLALCLIKPPGEFDVDVVVGSAQRFGVPMGFGGPYAGYMAVVKEYQRMLPGRLVGTSIDTTGRVAHRLALQTREQHIRREKATSNICTAQVLLAVLAAAYAAWHGPKGLRQIAKRVNHLTSVLALGIQKFDYKIVNTSFFDTLAITVPDRADQVLAAALQEGCNLRRIDKDTVGVSFDETTTLEIVESVWRSLGITELKADDLEASTSSGIPEEIIRTSEYCTAEFFIEHQTENSMIRWLRHLADRDLALDRTMIPLGSCTMKLNAAVELIPISWPEFSRIHPYAPLDQVAGYRKIITDLEIMLGEITGFDGVSLQPNAGSQGELAGLLAIRAWHNANEDPERKICLIPESAHGTNAASAVMAGMEVMVVKCDQNGGIEIVDLEKKALENSNQLAAIMVTYPSTHGVFEPQIKKVCQIVHQYGGQVYLDGANLNALVGLARPGYFGADVSHLNLHKTFAIPHGGGGPGIGPVAVRSHLVPFLPNHPVVTDAGPNSGVGAISAAPFGSAGILPITWSYLMLMGAEGLTNATQTAILSANYIAARLTNYFPVLYTGPNGRVAHECILDIRPLKKIGIDANDICKRLIDYGFHAPTVSWPVAGTLMVEPTESETLSELERFCDAMINISEEANLVAKGHWPTDDNPLVNAPHPAADIVGDWNHPYSREIAVFPLGKNINKYWPPVSRIDAAYGDKNLVCACPMIDDYR